MIQWRSHGLVFRPDGHREWMQSHAAMPVSLEIGEFLYRIYFGTRDDNNRPRIGFVDIDIREPTRIRRLSDAPVLEPGLPGYFDDNGVYPGRVLRVGDQVWMYYMGRSNGVPPLYYMAIGLAVSEDDGETFKRHQQAPIMARSEFDPWMVTTPWVMRDGDNWRMWYTSGIGWKSVKAGEAVSLYDIKYAESTDGIDWIREGRVSIALSGGETNITAPSVIRDDGIYRMWFCYAAKAGYDIGYAQSTDGIEWKRLDNYSQLARSTREWDCQTVGYPSVLESSDGLYLLYSGNDNGAGGFGIAGQE